MDTLRGNFADRDDLIGDGESYDPVEDDTGREVPPNAIGQDERRMQVRAYNHWASLLQDKSFPAIEDLDPDALPDFGPYSVLLDFTSGIENPGISFLGDELAVECGAVGENIDKLSDVPSRSLLSRITDHYMQILANQAPIGFEAEFVNQRGQTILYRGILLPFSSDDDTIDFIYGVINWKEMADQATTDELMLEIDQVLEETLPPARRADEMLSDWADGPSADDDFPLAAISEADTGSAPDANSATGNIANFSSEPAYPSLASVLPAPRFGSVRVNGYEGFEYESEESANGLAAGFDEQDSDGIDGTWPDSPLVAPSEGDFGLADWLAAARECALLARSAEDRSRAALYDAVGRAYDFSLAAEDQPEEYAELLAASGLSRQDRAPLTPLVKLVFGADYDKTRLTEYATALAHAHRIGLGQGELGAYLMGADGGLKGIVATERRLRREEAGKSTRQAETPRERIARQLRKIAPMGFETIAPEGEEFGVIVIRRLETGEVAVLGEVSDDAALVERAAKKLVA